MNATFFGQQEISSGYQALFWYIFLVDNSSTPSDKFFDDFLSSESFGLFCQPFVKKRTRGQNDRFLEGAFNREALQISKFRKLTRENLLNFLSDYAKSEDWCNDRKDFTAILDEFEKPLRQESAPFFFLISNEWFKKEDNLLSADAEIYIYFMLIIWFDSDKRILNVCQWSYD
jgi:hypothetical protein